MENIHRIRLNPKSTLKNLKFEEVGLGSTGPVIELNLSVKEIMSSDEMSGCKNIGDLKKRLRLCGFMVEPYHQFIASPRDYADFKELKAKHKSVGKLEEFEEALYSVLSESVKALTLSIDETTGLVGAIDYENNLVIPRKFDSIIYLYSGTLDDRYVDTPIMVKYNGKYNLTTISGGGELLLEDFDTYFRIGGLLWITRNDKHGIYKFPSLEVEIPCEMDWIIGGRTSFFTKIYSKNGKLGFMDGRYDNKYETKYNAIDVVQGKFYKDDHEVKDPEYKNSNWPKLVKEEHKKKGYWTYAHRLFCTSRNPFAENIKSLFDIYFLDNPEFISNGNSVFADSLKTLFIHEVKKIKESQEREMSKIIKIPNSFGIIKEVALNKSGKTITLKPIWSSTDTEAVKFDMQYPNSRNFTFVVNDKDGKPNFSFVRTFKEEEVEILSNFIADYIAYHQC